MDSITKLSVLLLLIGIIDITVARVAPRPRSYCFSLCPRGWTKWNNHCYKYVKSRVTGDAAENACVAQGGHLASINSLAEQNFVFNLWQTGGVGPSDSKYKLELMKYNYFYSYFYTAHAPFLIDFSHYWQ